MLSFRGRSRDSISFDESIISKGSWWIREDGIEKLIDYFLLSIIKLLVEYIFFSFLFFYSSNSYCQLNNK